MTVAPLTVPPMTIEPVTIEPVTLSGRHVRLEPLALAHIEPLYVAATAGSRETYRFTHVPADLPGMRAYVELAVSLAARGEAVPFATVDVAAGDVVGSTRFASFEYFLGNDGRVPDAVEIGWTWLAPRAQRTATNTEAKLLMLGHAFETWRVRRVTLKTDARNARSRAAIERLGAGLDGVLRADMLAYDGGVRDSAYYSILAAEWPAARARLTSALG